MSFRKRGKRRQSKLIDNSILMLPKTSKQLAAFECLNPDGNNPVSRAATGILVKWGGDHEEEVRALKFLARKLSIYTPRVLLHPPFPNSFVNPTQWGRRGVWYFYMEECPGVSLDKVLDTMTPAELDHVADQLSAVLAEMRSIKSRSLGSVSGGPYNNRFIPYPWTPKHAFESVGEFLSYYRQMLLQFCGAEYIEELFSSLPCNAPITLTHGDLLPCNTMVKGSEITGIIDWEMAGFYPDFWEYCRMHFSSATRLPGWDYILKRVSWSASTEGNCHCYYYTQHHSPQPYLLNVYLVCFHTIIGLLSHCLGFLMRSKREYE